MGGIFDMVNRPGFTSGENLLRIKRNDPTLKEVIVDLQNESQLHLENDIEALGKAIGNNTHVCKMWLHLMLRARDNANEAKLNLFQLFLEEISQNRSIENLWLDYQELQLGADLIVRSIGPFLERNNNLKTFRITFFRIELNRDNMNSIMAPLVRRETPLEKLDLGWNSIDDDSVEALVTLFLGNPAMAPKEIDLSGNCISDNGCRSLATLLQNPRFTLEKLNLYENDVKVNSAILFVNALVGNTTLKELNINGDCISTEYMTTGGLRAFSQSLCDTTNINTTYSSNHTLQVLAYLGGYMSPDYELDDPDYDSDDDYEIELRIENKLHLEISQYLSWNANDNKTIVARKKLFMNHFVTNFTMEPFEGMEPELLIRVLSFMEKASGENGGVTNSVARNLILSELVTKNPMICDIVKTGPDTNVNVHSRKRNRGY